MSQQISSLSSPTLAQAVWRLGVSRHVATAGVWCWRLSERQPQPLLHGAVLGTHLLTLGGAAPPAEGFPLLDIFPLKVQELVYWEEEIRRRSPGCWMDNAALPAHQNL